MIEIVTTKSFITESKKLSKKYKSFEEDLKELILQLEENPLKGIHLGRKFYKIRMQIKSKNKGKSGGTRIITLVRLIENRLTLVSIYDKSNISNISISKLIEKLK
jgi:mRNA-degrading endonuclease RelE of RelBE toxin-antitoxin system